jgi:uncharacterized membrane protein YfcA
VTVGVVIVVLVSVAAGAVVQSAVGFGLGLVAVPFLALTAPQLLPGPVILVGTALAVAVMIRDHVGIDFYGVRWAIVGRIFGNIAGAALVASLPSSSLSIFFALMVLLAIGVSMSGWRVRPSTSSFVAAGTASGVMGTTTAIGGPPIALVYQDAPGRTLRGSISAFFVVGSFISLVTLAAFGEFDGGDALAGLALVPAAAIGFLVSRWVVRSVDNGRVRTAVWITSASSSLIVLIRELWP